MEPKAFAKMIGWTLAPVLAVFTLGCLFVFPYVVAPLLAAGIGGAIWWSRRRKA
jgi:hypothetical protein